DADRVLEAASVEDEHELYDAQRSVLLDPHDPEVQRQAEVDGVPLDWIEAAQRSPIHKLINEYKVALPLHPEYRTMPMVWYIPPLSPWWTWSPRPGPMPRTPTPCSPPSTRCASPRSTWRTCSPPGTPVRSTGCCARWPPCAPICAT